MPTVVSPHPHSDRFRARVAALGRAWDRPSAWELFRFIDPRFSSPNDVVSGVGALHAAGRWHPPGATVRLAYTAAEPETALAETLAHARYYQLPLFSALPRVLVAVRLQATRVLDLREGTLRRQLRLSLAAIRATDWRRENRQGHEAPTQAWGAVLAAADFEAVVVPSAAAPTGVNVLVFPTSLTAGSAFCVDREVRWP